MVKTSDLHYFRFLLVLAWLACPASYGAESSLPLPLPLPSEGQCQMLWAQGVAEKPVAKQSEVTAEIEGWCLIIIRSKGNCLACHDMDITPRSDGLSAPGNIAPILANIANRFPNRIDLKNIIDNAASKNPQTFMPLFGKHEILTEAEIDRIVDFLMTL